MQPTLAPYVVLILSRPPPNLEFRVNRVVVEHDVVLGVGWKVLQRQQHVLQRVLDLQTRTVSGTGPYENAPLQGQDRNTQPFSDEACGKFCSVSSTSSSACSTWTKHAPFHRRDHAKTRRLRDATRDETETRNRSATRHVGRYAASAARPPARARPDLNQV